MSSFRKQLVTMVELQRAEMQIRDLEQDLAGIDSRIDALSVQVTEMEGLVDGARDQVENLKKQYRADESDVQLIDAQVEKSQEKLRAVKTNKEYQSTLKEIDDLRQRASGIEDRMLEHLEQIEASETLVSERQADMEEVKTDVADRQAEIRERGQAQHQSLQQWQQERERVLADIVSDMQTIYVKVKRQSNGFAMAAVGDGICLVCRMNIPPQLFNELMRMDTLKMCPHCQRIMYPKVVEEDLD